MGKIGKFSQLKTRTVTAFFDLKIYQCGGVERDSAYLRRTHVNNNLKEELREQIRPVEVVIILGGMYVAHSDWIQFEIDFAKDLNKPILGVRPWGVAKIPKAVQDVADEIVGWNAPTIVKAIQRLA